MNDRIQFEWAMSGALHLAPTVDAIVIVDVLSFTTCVSIALARGATIFPYAWKDDTAYAFAGKHNAVLAGERGSQGYSLSPVSLGSIPQDTKLVLPSPNGAAIATRLSSQTCVLAACLRNVSAVAEYVARSFGSVAVIACGERWPDGTLRPAIEDLIGAGALIDKLSGTRSPEAQIAATVYATSRHDLSGLIEGCVSGRELIDRGFAGDLRLAGEIDSDTCVPEMIGPCFVDVAPST